MTGELRVRRVEPADRELVDGLLREQWGSDRQAVRGELFRPADLPGFLALRDDGVAGLVTYRFEGDGCEVMSLNSLDEGVGVGSALVDAVVRTARAAGCRRLRVVTTNDNLRALRFYQRRGFRLVELRPGAVDRARAGLKPEIPDLGDFDIPLRDELELERPLE